MISDDADLSSFHLGIGAVDTDWNYMICEWDDDMSDDEIQELVETVRQI